MSDNHLHITPREWTPREWPSALQELLSPKVYRRASSTAADAKGDPWAELEGLPVETGTLRSFNPRLREWHHSKVFVRVQPEEFARGAQRKCFRMKLAADPDNSAAWSSPASNRVAKAYIDEKLPEAEVRLAMEEDSVCQSVAKEWAAAYNAADIVAQQAHVGPDSAVALLHPPKPVDFVTLNIVELLERPEDLSAGPRLFAVEPLIVGEYKKFNNNSGALVEDVHRQTPQAFSHFVWERSGGRVLVSDVQGVAELLTDPVIHTASGHGFGSTNLGIRGMALFFASHLHTPLLSLMGLEPFGLSPVEVRRLPALIREFQARAWAKTEQGAKGLPPPEVAFLAGEGNTVSLEEAAEAAAGKIPLGFTFGLAHSIGSHDAEAVKSAADVLEVGEALPPMSRTETGPRCPRMRRTTTRARLLGPSAQLMHTHRAATLARQEVAGAAMVSIRLAAADGVPGSDRSDEATPKTPASLKILDSALPLTADLPLTPLPPPTAQSASTAANALSAAVAEAGRGDTHAPSGPSEEHVQDAVPLSPQHAAHSLAGPSFSVLHAATHFDLALCHATGRLLHFETTDASAVAFHLLTAAEAFPRASLAAAQLADGEPVEPFPEDCVPTSPILSFRWFLRAARAGNRDAMVRVARLFQLGVPPPPPGDAAHALSSWEGIPPYNRAPEFTSQRKEEIRWVSEGVPPNADFALQWLLAAAKTDPDEDAERSLLANPGWRLIGDAAELYAKGGPGLEPDTARAYELYSLAAEQAAALGKGKAAASFLMSAEALG
jgi:hypothetical protein